MKDNCLKQDFINQNTGSFTFHPQASTHKNSLTHISSQPNLYDKRPDLVTAQTFKQE